MKLIVLATWLILSPNLLAQFPEFRPGWSTGPGLNQTTETIPKRYVGKHRALLELQLSYRGAGQWRSNRDFRFSQYHGMILIPKHLRTEPKFHWWSTGYTAIYSCVKFPIYGNELAAVLCSVWDQEKKVCRVVKLVFRSDGKVEQTLFGPASNKNAIWVAGSYVDRKLYVLEFQSITIIRFFDQDNDGNPKTLDSHFSIPVLESSKDNEPAALFDLAFLPLRSFDRASSEIVRLNAATQFCTGNLYWRVEQGASGPQVKISGDVSRWRKRLRISDCWLYAAQERVFISGLGESKFVMEAQLPDGTIKIISTNSQIEKQKWSHVVKLTEKLLPGWKIRAKSLQPDVTSSAWARVSEKESTSLFPPTTWAFKVGSIAQLEGSNIPPHVKGVLVDHRGKSYSLPIERVNEHEFHFKIPSIAIKIPKNNISYNEIATFHLVDLKSGELVSHELRICITPARPKKPKKD